MENLGKLTIKIDKDTSEKDHVNCFSIKGDKAFTDTTNDVKAEVFKSLRGIFKTYIREIEKELKKEEK